MGEETSSWVAWQDEKVIGSDKLGSPAEEKNKSLRFYCGFPSRIIRSAL
jgi:hypothetical protein